VGFLAAARLTHLAAELKCCEDFLVFGIEESLEYFLRRNLVKDGYASVATRAGAAQCGIRRKRSVALVLQPGSDPEASLQALRETPAQAAGFMLAAIGVGW
jgi:hypothetical protein